MGHRGHNEGMTTFITRYETSGPGVRLAVKDLIDMAGSPRRPVAVPWRSGRAPAASDAACLAGAREAGARIVGRTNLHELALGVTGINPWYGTPVNPLDPSPGARRLFERLRRCGRHWRGGRRLRQRHRRLGADSRRLLRHGRTEDDVGPYPARRGLAAGAQLRHRRPDGPQRGRAGDRDGAARAGVHALPTWAAPTWRSAGCPSRRIRPSPRRSTGRSGWWGGTAGT